MGSDDQKNIARFKRKEGIQIDAILNRHVMRRNRSWKEAIHIAMVEVPGLAHLAEPAANKPKAAQWLTPHEDLKWCPSIRNAESDFELAILIGLRQSLDRYRKKLERAKKTSSITEDDAGRRSSHLPSVINFVDELADRELKEKQMQQVNEEFFTLAPVDQQIILSWQDDKSFSEIALIVGLSKTTVRDRFVNAIDQLANAVERVAVEE